MYIDIGEQKALRLSEIIGVFDLDGVTISKKTREYLKICEKNGQIEDVSRDIPLSFVLTDKKVYFSPLLARTIYSRASKNF